LRLRSMAPDPNPLGRWAGPGPGRLSAFYTVGTPRSRPAPFGAQVQDWKAPGINHFDCHGLVWHDVCSQVVAGCWPAHLF
jgi:hypothetical protein